MSQNQDKEFENLFKRAAEHYPLDTDSADWDSVLNRLNEADQQKPAAFFNKRNTLLLLLLLAVSTISSLVTGLIVWNRAEKQNKHSVQLKTPAAEKTPAADSINGREKRIADQVYRKVIETLNSPQSDSATRQASEPTNKQASAQLQSTTAQLQPTTAQRKKIQPVTHRAEQRKDPGYTTNANHTAPADTSKQKPAAKPEQAAEVQEAAVSTPVVSAPVVAAMAHPTDSTAIKSDSGLQQNAPLAVQKKEKKDQSPGNKNFYAGILYARDESSIGFESNRGQGYSWQLLAGYRFAKRWSIESGIHIEKKEYYTTGNHTNKAFLNPIGNVLWIESESRLLEIPLTVKYDALLKKRHNLFVSAGLSSYIINREDFEYEEEVYGVIQKSNVAFTKTTSNLFSTVNLSLGYQYRLGKIGSIRIEPYLNLPISGIGKGESPIISKGIYAGWVYDFRKRKLKQ